MATGAVPWAAEDVAGRLGRASFRLDGDALIARTPDGAITLAPDGRVLTAEAYLIGLKATAQHLFDWHRPPKGWSS